MVFMRKGIEPVIAIVLLLMITIAIVGFAFGFFQRLLNTAAQNSDQSLGTTTNNIISSLSIESVSGTSLYIRNTGSTAIDSTKVNVYIDNSRTACVFEPSSIAVGGIANCTLGTACSSGQRIMVSGVSNSDTRTC